MSAAPSGAYLDEAARLAEAVERLRGAAAIAVDTEFIGEETYEPRLEIVQIGVEGFAAVVDLQALHRPLPLWDLLHDRKVLKVFHACGQDLPILKRASGAVPGPLFDTQVAAALVGYGAQLSAAALVERVTRHRIPKTEQFTDWSRRPLSRAQVDYALDDVRHLPAVHAHLRERLSGLGRDAWADEEFRRIERHAAAGAADDRERFRRVKGAERLGARELAILREVAAWREAEARRRDWPRPRLLPDDALVPISKAAPARVEALRSIRFVPRPTAERDGEPILAAIRRGLAVPEEEARSLSPPRPAPLPPGLLDLLQAFLRARAEALSLPASLLATSADLERLAAGRGEAGDLAILRGWRREAAGEDLLRILRGERALRFEPSRGRVSEAPGGPG